MALSKMTISSVALGFISGAAALANGISTETVSVQEIGSTTIDGAMVYSMNYCSIVHETSCQASLSTSGSASSSSTETSEASEAATTTAYESIPYPLPSASETTPTASVQVTPSGTPPGHDTSASVSGSATPTSAGSTDEHQPTGTEATVVPSATSAAMAAATAANGAVIGAVVVGTLFMYLA